jgi:hypothetical protein
LTPEPVAVQLGDVWVCLEIVIRHIHIPEMGVMAVAHAALLLPRV